MSKGKGVLLNLQEECSYESLHIRCLVQDWPFVNSQQIIILIAMALDLIQLLANLNKPTDD